jgi:hypothetical protein
MEEELKKQKPKKKYNYGPKKRRDPNPLSKECIASRQINYPDNRNWIGHNINGELVY